MNIISNSIKNTDNGFIRVQIKSYDEKDKIILKKSKFIKEFCRPNVKESICDCNRPDKLNKRLNIKSLKMKKHNNNK